jgi:hypothetical protein
VKLDKTLKIVIVTAIVAAGLTVGATAAVDAGASGSSVTYYACLKSGKLTDVGTSSPTCKSGAALISWSSQGPQGLPGANGTDGTNGVTYDCSAAPYPGVDFADCDLYGGTFTSANLVGANLSNATLTNALLSGADLSGANLAGAQLYTHALQNANLSDANLTGANFTGSGHGASLFNSDLFGANLMNAALNFVDLTDVDFTNADLTGAAMYQVNITGAHWQDTICPDGTNSENDFGTCANDL